MTNKPTADTIGLKPATVDRLWRQFRTAIDAAYQAADHHDPAAALRDYAENHSMVDKLDRLLEETTREERDHRRHDGMYGRPVRRPVTMPHAAKILILHAAGDGAAATPEKAPRITDWLQYRRTYVEAHIVGYLIRRHVDPAWVVACQALDYAAVMKD